MKKNIEDEKMSIMLSKQKVKYLDFILIIEIQELSVVYAHHNCPMMQPGCIIVLSAFAIDIYIDRYI